MIAMQNAFQVVCQQVMLLLSFFLDDGFRSTLEGDDVAGCSRPDQLPQVFCTGNGLLLVAGAILMPARLTRRAT